MSFNQRKQLICEKHEKSLRFYAWCVKYINAVAFLPLSQREETELEQYLPIS